MIQEASVTVTVPIAPAAATTVRFFDRCQAHRDVTKTKNVQQRT